MQKKTNLLGLNIDCISKDELSEVIDFSKKITISKVNTEFLTRALKDPEFFKTLANSDLIIADGIGVLWAAKYLSLPMTKIPVFRMLQAIFQMVYTGASLVFYPSYCKDPIRENIPGMEAFSEMLSIAETKKAPVYLLGSTDEVLEKVKPILKIIYPDLKIVGSHNGYDEEVDGQIIEEINGSGAEFLVVAMGSPKQEYWIRNHFNDLKTVKVAVGEGGSLEFLAGNYLRAPRWMQKLGLEWLWRLFFNKSKTHQTGSRARRIWNAVPVFIYEMVKYKLRNK